MGRKATIWFSLDRRPGGYFTGAGGKKQLLYKCREDDESTNGPNYRRAMKAFTTLLENLAEPDPFDQTFALCLERWYRHLEESCPATGKQARSLFRDLCDRLGHVEIPDLKGKWLLDYVRDRESWNDNTKASALKRLNGCFRWCLEEEHCSVNPLRGVKVNRSFRETARGEECVLPVALEQLLITNGRPAWRGFAVALSRTGARPGELANAERKHYYPADHVIILKDHKTAKRLKRADKRRIIHLDPEVEAIIRENLKRGDRLFPTTTGNKWDGKEWHRTLKRVLALKPVAAWLADNDHDQKKVIPYSFRHTYATRAIFNRVELALLANLMGTSVGMIERHYSHALANMSGMHDAYLRSIGQQPPPA